jgi:hypothetical protein
VEKTIALRFENVRFFKKPALYALKTLNFKLTLPSLAHLQYKHILTGRKAHRTWKMKHMGCRAKNWLGATASISSSVNASRKNI